MIARIESDADGSAVRPERARKGSQAADETQALCAAFLALKTPDEVRRFLVDLCTPAEIRAMTERWHVARLLDQGDLSYRAINEATGVSTATIVRVARFLREEPHQGYRIVLDRQNTRT
jgi:TrpR-related protein YerC/YecD